MTGGVRVGNARDYGFGDISKTENPGRDPTELNLINNRVTFDFTQGIVQQDTIPIIFESNLGKRMT